MCVDPDWEPFEILNDKKEHVGIAADIIKLAMIRVEQLLQEREILPGLISQIHDELLIEIPDHGQEKTQLILDEIRNVMEKVVELKVPLKVDGGFGYNWNEAQS